MKTEHDIRYTRTDSHKGEYWYECKACGKSDWIAYYCEYEQLNFYYTSCVTKYKEPVQLELFP